MTSPVGDTLIFSTGLGYQKWRNAVVEVSEAVPDRWFTVYVKHRVSRKGPANQR